MAHARITLAARVAYLGHGHGGDRIQPVEGGRRHILFYVGPGPWWRGQWEILTQRGDRVVCLVAGQPKGSLPVL